MSGDKTQVRTEVSANTAEQELLGRLSTKTHLLSLQYTAMPGKQPPGLLLLGQSLLLLFLAFLDS